MQIETIYKAIAGAVAAILASAGTAMADGDFTRPEGIIALGAGLVVGAGLVYAAPANVNGKREAE